MDKLVDLFASINQWHWFGLAIILIILELILGTSFFLLWVGVSAACIGVILLLDATLIWEYQFLIFTAIALVSLVFWHLHLKKSKKTSDFPTLNRRSEQYVGRLVTLDEPIVNGRGKIHIDDSYWRIEGPDLPAGTAVKVIGVDGVVLKVDRV